VLPWCQDCWQSTLHRDKVIQHIGKPCLRVIALLELHFQPVDNHTHRHAHFQVGKILPSTIGGSRGEWDESGVVMNVFVLAGKDPGLVLHASLLREPSLREERIGKGGEASRIPMDDIRWDERIVAFGNEAIIKEQSSAIDKNGL
jgi:hypothetical protein